MPTSSSLHSCLAHGSPCRLAVVCAALLVFMPQYHLRGVIHLTDQARLVQVAVLDLVF